MSFYKTKKFKDLQQKWDDKLKESGFKDAESRTKTGQVFLTDWHSFHFHKRYDPDYFQSKKKYYENAQDFYNHNTFDTEMHKRIWELHLEGLGVRVIAKRLNLKVWRVHETIRELLKIMYGR